MFFWPKTPSNIVPQVNMTHWAGKLHLWPLLCPWGHLRSWNVPNSFVYHNFRQKHARALKTPWMCSAQRYESNDIQHDLFCDFDLRLDWIVVFGRHNYNGYMAPITSLPFIRWKKNAGKARLCSKVAKRYNVKLADFWPEVKFSSWPFQVNL